MAQAGRLDHHRRTGRRSRALRGAAPTASRSGSAVDRDAWEIALLDAAEAAGRPVLGICRGMQLMAVAGRRDAGAAPARFGRPRRTRSRAPSAYGWTAIRTVRGSLVQRAGRRRPAGQLSPSPGGGEASGLRGDRSRRGRDHRSDGGHDRPFWLGVQWHPESGDDHGLFIGLAEAGRAQSREVTA